MLALQIFNRHDALKTHECTNKRQLFVKHFSVVPIVAVITNAILHQIPDVSLPRMICVTPGLCFLMRKRNSKVSNASSPCSTLL